MKLNKLLLKFQLIALPILCGSSIVTTSKKLVDVEIGYVTLDKPITTSIYYQTNVNGIYNVIVTVNGHQTVSSSTTVTKNTLKVFGLSNYVIDNTWLYPTGNTMSIEVLNQSALTPTVVSQSVTFNAGFSDYYEITNNSTTIVKDKCYLRIKATRLSVCSDTYTITKDDEFVECVTNNINILNNKLEIISPANSKNPFQDSTASLIIRNHPKAFKIGRLEYDSSTKTYYNVIPLMYSYRKELLSYIFEISSFSYWVSYSNLMMDSTIDASTSSCFFKSKDFFLPIGLNENNNPYVFELLIENVGFYNDSFCLKTSYYPPTENFGSCYIGDYCIYQGRVN